MTRNLNRLYRQHAEGVSPINLSIGHPELSHLVSVRKRLLRSAQERLGSDEDPDAYGGYGEETEGNDGRRYATEERMLQYGDHDGMSQGQPAFRKALSDFLKQAYRQNANLEPHNLFVTNGSSQALELACDSLTNPGDTIFVQDPTYFCALSIFRDHKLRIVGVKSDSDGLDPDDLERLLQHEPSRPAGPRLVYSVTAFNNPSGATLSDERRKKLVALAERYDLIILSDEVYHLLSYSSTLPPAPIACYRGAQNRVISMGSFSKILAPGMRLGWIQCAGSDPNPTDADTDPDAPRLIKQLVDRGYIISGGGLNPFTSGVVRPLLSSGSLHEQLESFKSVYQRKRDVLSDALRTNLPDGCSFQVPEGGFFIWLALPKAVDAAALLPTAMNKYGVGYLPGVHCAPNSDEWKNYCRICFCHYEEEQLIEATLRLSRALGAGRG